MRVKLFVLTLGLTGCLLLIPGVTAGVEENNETNGSAEETILRDEGIRGLIVDNTRTIIGKRFYEAFALHWLDQRVGDIDNLSVGERPTARSGSRVWVEYDRQILFQVFLSPVLANIEQQARTAAAKVGRRIQQLEIQRALFKNPDLADDEF